MRMKFGDMKAGQRFSDGRRTFIKLQTLLPSGYRQIHERVIVRNPDGTMMDKPDRIYFNSVDNDGGPANCPDMVEFTIIED